jgi:hypothetical protein
MRRFAIIAGMVTSLVAVGASHGSPHGVSPAQLGQAGWGCAFVLGAVHCARPGGFEAVVAGDAETMAFLVFETDDPASEDAPFLGMEHIVRSDLFRGQPCPTDPPSQEYTDLGPLLGLPYFACHRYDSGF